MKKILFITYQFPPFGGSHSTRTLNIANELSRENEVIVLTVEITEKLPFYDFDLYRKVNQEVKIKTAPMGILHAKDYNSKEKEKIKDIKFILKSYLKKNKKSILIPDTVIDWYPKALREARKIVKEYKPDVILSSATPYTNHLIAWKVAKENNLELFLDYGDPWVYEQSVKRGIIRFLFEKYLERKILKRSSHIFVTTKNTKKLYEKNFQIQSSKISVAYMGFEPRDFMKILDNSKNEKLEFIYGGSLNPIHRNPIIFFKAISKLSEEIKNKISIEIYTGDEALYSDLVKGLGIDNVVKFNELISHDKFMDMLQKKNILILFGNSDNLQIPGKIFNYIGSLTNIFLINNQEKIQEDETNDIISEFENNFIVKNELNQIKRKLEEIYHLWEKNNLKKNLKEDTQKYSWKESLQSIGKVINKNA